jgi:hypothetical protein
MTKKFKNSVVSQFIEEREINLALIERIPEYVAGVVCNTFNSKQRITEIFFKALYNNDHEAIDSLAKTFSDIAYDLKELNGVISDLNKDLKTKIEKKICKKN